MWYDTAICAQMREEEVYYEKIGSYQWEWVLFTFSEGTFKFREWGYGSCEICDHYLRDFPYDYSVYNYDETVDSMHMVRFANQYQPKKAFTKDELVEYHEKNPTLHGFIPFSAKEYHEDGYDTAIIEGLRACLEFKN